MEYKVNVLDQSEKYLIKEIVSLFLNNKSYEEIANIKGKNIEYIKWTLSSKFIIRKIYSDADDIWNLIKQQKKTIEKNKIETKNAQEYKKNMDNLIFYLINSLYNYDEIGERIYLEPSSFKKMVTNEEYIINNYGQKKLDELKLAIEMRKTIPKNLKYGNKIIKDPKYRALIKKDILVVTKYQHSLIEKVALFFDCNGSIENMVDNTEYHLNEIYASLNDSWLKDSLNEKSYQKLQTLLKVDTILTQNKMTERNMLIENIILITYKECGNINRIEEIVGYPIEVIERVLNHPYVSIACKKLKIDESSIKLKTENENNKKKIKG